MRGNRARSRAVVLVAACAIVAALAVPSPASSAAPLNPSAPFLGVIPSVTSGASAVAHPYAQQPVTYHDGKVQHSSTAYTIFWQPSGYPVPFPSGYTTVVNRFFTDVAAFSYKPSNVFSVATQYSETVNSVKTPVFYAVTARPVIIDTRPFPLNTANCPNYRLNDGTTSVRCLTNAQLVNELRFLITSMSLPTGLATNYFLYAPAGAASCMTRTSLSTGGCYDPQGQAGFCAYHSSFVLNQKWVLWANMPYAMVNGCASGQAPQNSDADSVLNTTAHEFIETMTDPLGTGWFDTSGNEIADKCAMVFGAPLGSNSSGQYNQVINSHGYWIQEMWSNRAQACVQRNTFAQPVSSFTFSPASPAAHQTVTFHSTATNPDNTALKLRWVFPNGTTSSAATATFVFTAPGTYKVSLIVWDAQGDQARLVKSVAVH